MNLLTTKKTELLNDFQRFVIEDALRNKRDFDLIITKNGYSDNTLQIVNFPSINSLYDYLYVNYSNINYDALYHLNDVHTVNIVNILLDLIKKELDLDYKYRRLFLDINDMLKKYDDFVIQYTYENYLTKEYKYYSTRSLNGFYLTVKKEKAFIFSDNKLLIDAVKYAVDNNLVIIDWLGVDIL